MGLFEKFFNKRKLEQEHENRIKQLTEENIKAEKELDEKVRILFIALVVHYDYCCYYPDKLLKEAARAIVEEQQASISLIKRKLNIDNITALKLMDELKFYCIIEPFSMGNPNKVLYPNLEKLELYLRRVPLTYQDFELFFEQNKDDIEKGRKELKLLLTEIKSNSLKVGQEQGFKALLDYLKENFKINDLTPKEQINIILEVSDYYERKKQGDNVFNILSLAEPLTVGLDKKSFLLYQTNINRRQAYICLEEKKYSTYLHFLISSFLLSIACSITQIYDLVLGGFFDEKKISYNEGHPFENNEDFNDALEDLNILKHKKYLLNDIFNYAYQELPLLMGVPGKYLNEEYVESVSIDHLDNFVNSIPEKQEMEANMALKPNIEHALVSRFVGQVVKKYYDLER